MTTLTIEGVEGTLITSNGTFPMGAPTEVAFGPKGVTFTFYRAAAGVSGLMLSFDLRIGSQTARRRVPNRLVTPSDDIHILQLVELDLEA